MFDEGVNDYERLTLVLVKRALPFIHLMKCLMKELLVTGFTSSFD